MSGTYKNDAEEASGSIAAHAETLANLATRWLTQRDTFKAERDTARAEVKALRDALETAVELLPDFVPSRASELSDIAWRSKAVKDAARAALSLSQVKP